MKQCRKIYGLSDPALGTGGCAFCQERVYCWGSGTDFDPNFCDFLQLYPSHASGKGRGHMKIVKLTELYTKKSDAHCMYVVLNYFI